MPKVGRLVKDSMVQELTTRLSATPNFFVTSVGPLQAGEADTLRKRLRGTHASLLMAKRTLSLRGVAGLKLEEIGTLFSGSVAFVLPGEDLIRTAKTIVEFAKANQHKLAIRGGWVDGQVLDETRVEELANLPPKPQLIAQIVSFLESPMAQLVMILEHALGDLAWVLEEAAKQRDKQGNPEPATSP